MISPKYEEKAMGALNWTREKIMKWTGMGVAEFADLLGVPKIVDWSNLTDAKALLKEAAILGHEGTVRMLLEKRGKVKDGDDVNPDVIEAFHYACFYGNEWIVRLCLDYVPHVNALDAEGRTGLHKAAQKGRECVIAALLECGADLDKRDMYGNTPLDEALAQNHDTVIRLFMRRRGALVASSKRTSEAPLAAIRSAKNPTFNRFTGMNATIVDFYVDTSTKGDEVEEHRVERKAVETLIWDDELGSDTSSDMISGEASSDMTSGENYPDPDFKWIHLPANNVSILHVIVC